MLSKKQKHFFVGTFFLLLFIASLISFQTAWRTEAYLTPHNMGVINYYFYDAFTFFTHRKPNPERLEVFISQIGESGEKRNYFGLAKDRNVFVIQAESVHDFVINAEINEQEITPVMNEIIRQESIYFSNFYEQVGWGNTSDAEFIAHNSFYPSQNTYSYNAYEGNEFATLPMYLQSEGYSTIVFHGNDPSFWNREAFYPSQGIERFISKDNLEKDEIIGMGISDGSLFRQSINFLKEQSQPFYSFYITLTSHHPFIINEEYRGLDLQPPYKDTYFDGYMQTVNYLDGEIGNFIELLKENDLYEDSIIVIFGDHQGLDLRDINTNDLITHFLGKPYEEDEMFRVPLIIHIPGSNINKEITTAGGQIDFFPTMANLLGVNLRNNRAFGKDLLNIEEGFVAKQTHVARGSFIDNEKIFIMSNDGIFEHSRAWNLWTREPVALEDCIDGYQRAKAEIELSEYILENNLIPLTQDKGLEVVFEQYLQK